MDSIKQTITELSTHFNTRMEEFQRNIQGAIPATSPTSNIAAQFNSFRSFVLAALEGLQMQVQLLYRSNDEMEMRSRRKMLLIHGLPEGKDENICCVATKALVDHLKIPVSSECVSRCHRLGRSKADKPRAVLIKFCDLGLRNKLWYAKTGLKNTGITLSEFLTKERHDVFVAARQRFGVSQCWTKDGNIFVTGQDGSRHRVRTTAQLDLIPTKTPAPPASIPAPSSVPGTHKTTTAPQNVRSKRAGKK